MRIVVQKYGGTSLASEEGRAQAARRVLQARRQGLACVLVVSAMGRHPQPYATDTLLGLVTSFNGCTDSREMDMLAACGEIISCVVMSACLRSLGQPARALSGPAAGILTDGHFGEAAIQAIDPRPLRALLEEGVVPVVAGFQGATSRGEVTTLGRGGSDTTAVALGAALGAERVEIYTDVEGVFSADPRVVPQARLLARVDYEEMAEMASEGARVLHPRAVGLAQRHQVPTWVKGTFSEAPGTLVAAREPMERLSLVTGVVTVPGLTQVDVRLGTEEASPAAVLEALAGQGISLDLINLTSGHLFFVVPGQVAQEKAGPVLEGLGLDYRQRPGCAKVSVVGTGMRGRPGVMARVNRALERAGVKILRSTDSHITLSCLVDEGDLVVAARALHEEFCL
ncbi:MAG TPA: aspartate kinase [Candidatus Nitrosotenuis sp.]|nr:aspartate kinase [Candidatus Nitrosotenuis sp.]